MKHPIGAVLFCLIFNICGVYTVSITTDTWIQMATPVKPPSAMAGQSAVVDPVNNTMVLFGGNTGSEVLNNITFFSMVKDAWSIATPKGTLPRARYGHSAVVYHNTRMIVFGGRNLTRYFNDIAVYNLVNNQWVSVAVNGSLPSKRAGHSAVVDTFNNRMIVFGGQDESGNFLSDLSFLDLATFTWSNVSTKIEPRAYHSAIISPLNIMIIYGGKNSKYISDTSCYNLNNGTWITCVGADPPEARAGHVAVLSPVNQMVVFGGIGENGLSTSSVWNFDVFTYKWVYADPGGAPMDPRYQHSGVASPFGTLIVFGGYVYEETLSNSLAKYNLANAVIRNANDGAVMVVLISLVGTILISLCFALDYMQEQNEIEKEEAIERAKMEVSLLPKMKLPKIPLGPKAQKFFSDVKVSLNPLHEPTQ